MSLFTWLRPSHPPLDATQQQRLAQLPAPAELQEHSLRAQRWVVLDLETSGLNLNRDQVLSIGAVVIEDGAIDLGQQFERTLHRHDHKPGPSVLIHGLSPSAIAAAVHRQRPCSTSWTSLATARCWRFHAGFDQRMLGRALKESLGYRLQHPFFDVAELAPLLNPNVVLRDAGLDDWTACFGLHAQERHHASADAQVTAELALILFSQARRQHLDSPLLLEHRLQGWRRRRQHSHGF
ncbi:3'-5' exonuclease [Pseudomonas sp. MAFF212428]|uniref:3'-5' exonuclease n=1 Tax=Pseudomonas brassicae TaxID=2708063 RepID=A0A6M0CWL7_9PSED|nr:3'-5' exonuclease [Pseudomonas brassicae]